jgi:murein DD-endopeptidase MepM/ murein hydrolase activator NlpD
VNHQPIFNRDVKSQVSQQYRQPAMLRMTYLAIFGLVLVATVILWGSNPAQVEANIQAPPEITTDSQQRPLEIPRINPGAEDSALVIPGKTSPAEMSAVAQEETAPELPASKTPENSWHNITVKSGDSLAVIFSRLGIKPQQLHKLLTQGGATHNLKKIYPGQTLRVQTNSEQGLLALIYPIDKLSSLEVRRDGDDFVVGTTHRTPEFHIRNASVKINNSLFLDAHDAGLSDHLIMELAGIFAWDVDFALDIRKGDHFTVLYEEQFLDGENIGNENIIAAEFVIRGKNYHAIRYTDNGGKTDFYALNGKSMRKTFLRTPVEFSRISSRFSLGRKHPILNRIRAHKGVDYAASRGTPIKATGNGKIVHRGKKGGYGNTIIIQHGTRYSTLYAHMSKYRGGLKKGSRVKQGQTIGYVGSSGLATGPHLHYEFRVDGAHRDPLRVKLPGAKPLDKKYLDDFTLKAQALVTQLNLVRNVQVASR